jgi:hypothetical protein
MFDEKPEAKISFRLAFKPHIVGIPIFDIFWKISRMCILINLLSVKNIYSPFTSPAPFPQVASVKIITQKAVGFRQVAMLCLYHRDIGSGQPPVWNKTVGICVTLV